MFNEKIGSTKTSNYNQAPRLVYSNARMKLNFSGDLLKQDKVIHNHGPVVNIYIVYRLTPGINNNGFTLENGLFGAVKLTKSTVLININILDMVLDLIQEEVLQVVDMVKMLLFLGLI